MAGKFKAFINVMLADDEKEWKIIKDRHPQFFDDKENQKFKCSPLAELLINKSMKPKMFLSFMIINEIGWTFDESVRIDENDLSMKLSSMM